MKKRISKGFIQLKYLEEITKKVLMTNIFNYLNLKEKVILMKSINLHKDKEIIPNLQINIIKIDLVRTYFKNEHFKKILLDITLNSKEFKVELKPNLIQMKSFLSDPNTTKYELETLDMLNQYTVSIFDEIFLNETYKFLLRETNDIIYNTRLSYWLATFPHDFIDFGLSLLSEEDKKNIFKNKVTNPLIVLCTLSKKEYIDLFSINRIEKRKSEIKKIIKCMINYGLNVDNTDYLERTPLMYAARNGNLELIKILVNEFNADINKEIKHSHSGFEISPLNIALICAQIKATNYFLEHKSIKLNKNKAGLYYKLAVSKFAYDKSNYEFSKEKTAWHQIELCKILIKYLSYNDDYLNTENEDFDPKEEDLYKYPLFTALEEANLELAHLLLNIGLDSKYIKFENNNNVELPKTPLSITEIILEDLNKQLFINPVNNELITKFNNYDFIKQRLTN